MKATADGDFTLAFLVRHGQAAVPDQEGRYFSKAPVPLTERGEQQAAAAGDLLRTSAIDAIWSSDLLRARQTAEIIARVTGVPVCYDKRLQEVDTGTLDGSSHADLEHDHPEFLPWIRAGFRQGFSGSTGHLDANLRFPGGESVADASMRAVAAFQEIAAAHLGGCIALVAHAWVTSSVLCHVLEIPVTQYFRFGTANAGVSLVRVGVDGHGMLDALNLAVPLSRLAGGSVPQRQHVTSHGGGPRCLLPTKPSSTPKPRSRRTR